MGGGQECAITVTFTPAATGPLTATLNLTDYAIGSPQQIALSGTGTAPTTTLSPASLSFGNVSVNAASGEQTVTVTNTGNVVLSFNSIAVTGANAAAYRTTNTCGPVAPGGQCKISVFFAPGSAAVLPATLSVSDNAVGSPQTVSLTGTGVAGPVDDTASVDVSSSAFVYNHVQKIYTGTVTVLNTGALPLSAPWYVVLTQLPAGVASVNASGNAAAGPYYNGAGALYPGAAQSFTAIFTDPGQAVISFTPKIYSGPVQ